MFLPVKMGELWPSCGRVVPSIGRVVPSIGRVVAELSEFLGELLGEIVKFRQLAQKRLGGHLCLGGGGGGRGYDSSHFGWDQTHGKFIWHYLAISKATAGEKHPQSGSQGACGPKNDPEATPEYKKMEKNSEKTAFFTFWPLWAK